MASDLISRDALLKELGESLQAVKGGTKWMMGTQQGLENAVVMVKEAPAVDAEPVRHAEWIPWEYHGKVSKHLMTCSGCRRYQWPKNDVLTFDRCPKCGAKMDGGKQDAE